MKKTSWFKKILGIDLELHCGILASVTTLNSRFPGSDRGRISGVSNKFSLDNAFPSNVLLFNVSIVLVNRNNVFT